jgi:hypothetical protein
MCSMFAKAGANDYNLMDMNLRQRGLADMGI